MQTIGIWSQNLRGSRPRGVGRVAREISDHLLATKPENCRYFLVHDALWRAGIFLLEIEPILAIGERRQDLLSHTMGRRFEPAVFFDAILSFECFESVWEWPLRQYGIKSVCVIYDLIPFRINEHYSSDGATRYFKTLSHVVDAADALICISKSTHSDLISFFPQAENKAYTCYIGHGSSILRGRANGGPVPSSEPDIATILMVGTVERRKNFHTVLSAVPEIARGLGERPLRIVFAGDAEGRGELLRHHDLAFARANSAAELTFVDFVPDEALAALYRQADVVIFPSLWEGFGIPILEALSFGVAVIASGLSSHPEVGRSHVRYCDPYVPANIAAKVLEVFQASEGRRAWDSARGRLWASRFNWDRAAQDYKRVLSGLIEGHIDDLTFVRQVSEEVYPPSCKLEVAEVYYLPLSQLVPFSTFAVQALIALVRKRTNASKDSAAIIFVADSEGPGIEALDVVVDAMVDITEGRTLLPFGVAITDRATDLSPSQLLLIDVLNRLDSDSYEDGGVSNAKAQASGWVTAKRAITVDRKILSCVPTNTYEAATVLDLIETDITAQDFNNQIEYVSIQSIRDLVVDHDLHLKIEIAAISKIITSRSLARAIVENDPAFHDRASSSAKMHLTFSDAVERSWSILIIEDGLSEAMKSAGMAYATASRLPTLKVHLNAENMPSDSESFLLPSRISLQLLMHCATVVIGRVSLSGALDDDFSFATKLGIRVVLVGDRLDHLAERVFGVAIAPDLTSALAIAGAHVSEPIELRSRKLNYIPGVTNLIGYLQLLKLETPLSLDALAEAWLLVRRRGMTEMLEHLVSLGLAEPGGIVQVENAVNLMSPGDLLVFCDKLRDHLWRQLQSHDVAALEQDCNAVSAGRWLIPQMDLRFLHSAKKQIRAGDRQCDLPSAFACSPDLTFTIEPITNTDQVRCEVNGISRSNSWRFPGGTEERNAWVHDVRLSPLGYLPDDEQVAVIVDLKGATDAFSGDRAIELNGFHSVEYDDYGEPSHRWSGPGLKSWILIPLFVDASCEIRVSLVHIGAHESPEEITVTANGIAAVIDVVSGDFVIQLPPPKEPIPIMAIEVIIRDLFNAELDDRAIGVALGRISIRAIVNTSTVDLPVDVFPKTVAT